MKITSISFIYLLLVGLYICTSPVLSATQPTTPAKHAAGHDDHGEHGEHGEGEVEVEHENEHDVEETEVHIEDYGHDSFMNAVAMSEYALVLHLDHINEEANQKYEQFFETLKPEIYHDERAAHVNHLGRVGHEEQLTLAKELRASKTPAFILYDHARPFTYEGPLNETDFVKWIDQILLREIKTFKTQEELNAFITSDNDPKVIAFYKNETHANETNVLEDMVHHDYLVRQGIRKVGLCLEDCPNTYKGHTFKRPSFVVFRSFDSQQPYVALETELGDFRNVFNFAHMESLPPVLIYDEINQTRIFDESIPAQLYLIVDPKADNSHALGEFTAHALNNRHDRPKDERMLHIEYPYDSEIRGLRWLFGNQTISDLPKVFISEATVELDQINKFEFPKGEKITVDSLEDFVAKYRKKEVPRYYISEPIPTDNEGKAVKRVVGRTFTDEVLRSLDNSIVFVCANFDQKDCQEGLETFTHVAEKVRRNKNSKDANIQFSAIDVGHNEATVNGLQHFPHIMLLKAGQKQDQKIYQEELDEDELYDWVAFWFPNLKKKVYDDDEL